MTGNRQDTEEILQDVFLTVFKKIDGFRGDAKLSSWIYRIATNVSLMKLRKRPKVREIPLENELGPKMTEEGMIADPVIDWSTSRLRQMTRPVIITDPVMTSARRFIRNGCIKQKFVNLFLVALYYLGFDVLNVKEKLYPEIR